MIKGFKEFIMRGNVVDLAVAFVIGAAFAAVIDTVVSSIITPVLAAFGGAAAGGLGFQLVSGNAETYIDVAAIINAIIVFLLTALVVYLVFVLPMNKYNELRARRSPVLAEVIEVEREVELLEEIRDLLRTRQA